MMLLKIATIGLASLTLASAASAAEYTMRLSHGDNKGNPTYLAAKKFEELAEKYTDGKVDVKVFPNNQLGSEQEVAQALRTGTVEAEVLATTNLLPFAPSVGVLMLPYAFNSSEQAWAAMDALTKPLNERVVDEAGVRILGFFEKGFRVLTNSVRPVETLEDLKGLKIRVSKSKIGIATFKSWGISPVPMAWAEVFPALQQGVIDGQENPYTTSVTSKFYEVQRYITEIHYMIWSGPLIVSERFFQQLPADIQDALLKAGQETAEYERRVAREKTEEAKATLKEKDMTLSGAPKDEDEWRKRAKALWPDLYADIGGKEWAQRAINIINDAKAGD